MIKVDGKTITGLRVNGKIITNAYYLGKRVWTAIKSCFGRGFWINKKPWSNNEGWVN